MCLKHYRPGQGYDPHFHRAGETVVGDTKMDETTTDGDEDDDEDDEKEERVNARHFEKLVVQKIQLGMRRLVENEDAEKVAKAFDRRYGTVLEEMASSSDRNGEGTNTDAGEKEERDVEDLDEVGVVAASLPYHNNNYAPFASSSIMKSNANATKIPQHYRKQRPKFSIKSARNTRPIAIPRSGKIIPGFITKSFPNHSVNPKSTSTIQDLSSIEEEQQKTFSLLIKKQPEIIKQESNHSTLSRSSSSRSSLVLDLLDEFPVSLTILTSGPYSGKSFRWVNENQPLYCQRLIRGKQQAASSPIKLKATAAGYDGSETSFRNWLLKEHGLEDLT